MRFTILHLSLLAGLAGMIATGTASAQVTYVSPGVLTAAPQVTSVPPAVYSPPALPKAAAVQRLLTADAPRRTVTLPSPSATEREHLKSANAPAAAGAKPGKMSGATGKGRPLAIGYGRDIPAADRVISGADLTWVPMADGGRAARVDVASQGAAAVRIALEMNEADPDITLRFAGSDARGQVFGPYPANRIAEQTNKEGVFWSPVLEGETGSVEVYLPAGVAPETVRFKLARVSHLAVAGAAIRNIDPKLVGIGGAASCEIDIACVTPAAAEVTNAAKSVTRIVFTQEDGQSYYCTATLMNDSMASSTPYVFTASHCMNSQMAASTLNLYWFFDAVACRSLTDPPYVLQDSGATMLGRSDDYDWAMVRLNAPPPAGAVFAAWRADPLGDTATTIATIHHPMGDLKKWSQGTTQGIRTFEDRSQYVSVRYNQGSTEPGSSGSALFTLFAPGGYYELRGGLFGGDASCRNVTGFDYYSRLDIALPLMRQYLTPGVANPTGAVPAVEYYNALLNDYFITVNPAEIMDLDSGLHAGWERTGLRFLAYQDATSAPPGATPVCRFYVAPAFGDSHFYSADPAECAATAAKFSEQWLYEAADVFYILLPNTTDGSCPANSHPIFRFVNDANGLHHRYTAEVDLRDMIIDEGDWTQEGYGNPARGSGFASDAGQVVMCSPNS